MAGVQPRRGVDWAPNSAPQVRFLSLPCYEALFGGSGGGGKTDSLVMGALRLIAHPRYAGIIFRRTYPELKKSVIPRTKRWYPTYGGIYNESDHVWRFPSGAEIWLSFLDRDGDAYRHQSAEYQYIAFDELTHFTEFQYTYMLSRGRSTSGLPIRVRGGTNPDDCWVFRRWGPWLNPECVIEGWPERTNPISGDRLPPIPPGEILYYRNTVGSEAQLVEQWLPRGTQPAPGILSRCFVPARATDNPDLIVNDPEYIERLKGLDPINRARLLDGDWLVRPSRGMYFKRGWFDIVDAAPADALRIRHWDLASTAPEPGKDPDWTAGLRFSRQRGTGVFFVEDVRRIQGDPGQVENEVKTTTALDNTSEDPRRVAVHIAQDPGQAGKSQIAYYIKQLAGYNVLWSPETGDKIVRAGPVSAQARARNIKIVRGPWNEAFLAELEAFPEGNHDDQVDALSGAFNKIAFLPDPLPPGERSSRPGTRRARPTTEREPTTDDSGVPRGRTGRL